jgi:hypothetical protein
MTIQLRNTVYDDFEVLGIHDDLIEQLVDDDSASRIARFGPLSG